MRHNTSSVTPSVLEIELDFISQSSNNASYQLPNRVGFMAGSAMMFDMACFPAILSFTYLDTSIEETLVCCVFFIDSAIWIVLSYHLGVAGRDMLEASYCVTNQFRPYYMAA